MSSREIGWLIERNTTKKGDNDGDPRLNLRRRQAFQGNGIDGVERGRRTGQLKKCD